jgi:hypothetical protein
MRKSRQPAVPIPGFLQGIWLRLRGTEELVIRGPEPLPILLVQFSRSRRNRASARLLELACKNLVTILEPDPRLFYEDLWERLPSVVVVIYQPRHPGGALGHSHWKGTESALAKRLAAETQSEVDEIDLAWESIRQWSPRPIASLAASASPEDEERRFQIGLLTVLFHELEHLAYPDRQEREVRDRSNRFYELCMEAFSGLSV